MSNKVKQGVVDKVYASLLEESSERVKGSLGILKSVCDELVKKGRLNFSIAEVGRLSEVKGGPKTQTIRNDTLPAQAYRALLEIYESIYRVKKIAELGLEESIEQTLASIEDPKIRIKMLDLIAENKKLKSQIRQQQAALNAPASSDINGNPVSSNIALDPIGIKALCDFISPVNLSGQNWSISNQGQIIDANGTAITKRGFADAIDKLSVLSEQQ